MIELAQRRLQLKRQTAQAAARAAEIDCTCIYLTVRDIAAERGLSVDQVRYALRNVEPARVPSVSGASSYAYGYPEKVVAEVFAKVEVTEH